jgi:hypothetical protein
VSLAGALQEMAAALQPVAAEIDGLQITAGYRPNPTPPSIDIYPATPFQEGAGFGVGSKRVRWIVRARVTTIDIDAANLLLLRLLDVDDPASVEAALQNVAVLSTDGGGTVTGFAVYNDDPSREILGVTWDGMEMFL